MKASLKDRCVIGVDLGGTNVRAGAFSSSGEMQGSSVSASSCGQEGIEATIEAILGVVEQAMKAAYEKPQAIGIAVPGHVDGGLVRWAPNLGEYQEGKFFYWKDVPLQARIEEAVGLPVRLGNDANLAALGEYRYGSGENRANCLVLLTLGTGIGGGVVMASRSVAGDASGPLLLLGGNQGGAELGHLCIQQGGLDAPVGSYGSLEAYCQRDAILRRATHQLQRGRTSILNTLCNQDLAKLTPEHLSIAADQGDEVAQEVWEEIGLYLGTGIGSLINVFAPDVFAIGGQIAKAGEWILGPARKAAQKTAIPTLFAETKIVQAQRIDEAGLIGAAAWAVM